MIVITFDHIEQYKFLLHTFSAYTKAGLEAQELPIAADTYMRLMGAKEVPTDTHLGKAQVAEMGPNGIALEFPEAATAVS